MLEWCEGGELGHIIELPQYTAAPWSFIQWNLERTIIRKNSKCKYALNVFQKIGRELNLWFYKEWMFKYSCYYLAQGTMQMYVFSEVNKS